MLRLFNKRRANQAFAGEMYRQIVACARHRGLYAGLGVADTLEGRFEMLMLHVIVLLRRLRALGEADLAQDVFDVMFEDMDQALRELGVSDLAVSKRIRPMAEAFYGRASIYEAGLMPDAPEGAFEAAIARNVYGRDEVDSEVDDLAGYARSFDDALSRASLDELAQGSVDWPVPREAP